MKPVLLVAIVSCLQVAAEPVSYVIDLADRRQPIDHFGANDKWTFQKIGESWSEESRNRIADLLYRTDKGIGLSFCRFSVGGGINRESIRDEWRTSETFEVSEGKYDWNRLAGQRWFLRAAKARGVRQFGLAVYSPPMRLTRTGLTNHGDDVTSTTNLKDGAEAAFAGYLVDILERYRNHPDEAERVEFDRVFPHNEPKWDWQAKNNQEGNRASNEDLRKVHLALQQELRKRKLRTLIAAPESGSIPGMYELNAEARRKWKADYGNYLPFFAGDADLARGVGGVLTYHSYWSDRIPEELVPHREELAATLAAHRGWRLWQTEYCVMETRRDLGIDTALRVARIIHCDLAIANASAWQWWLAVSKGDYKDGLIYTDWHKPGDEESIHPSKTFWVLGNYSRFIRPGMRRVGIRGGEQEIHGLMTSAYLDLTARKVVVVCVNMSDKPRSVRLALARGERLAERPLMMTPHVTSGGKDLEEGDAVDAATGHAIPARSVVTFVTVPGARKSRSGE